ncbi:RES family NAD+ phosphorylase [Pseudomonas mandelii]|uniref:RES domain-containing protein n=1 Tax=Pseudomonas mandelii TaxID=75612 RepID=A0ABY0VVR2_9PSED|nr:RES family NAD+ phosphorylase [Pseudomonas mandelii]TWS07959.1 RES domain-containing protein [Pseudomonas mandelii]SDU58469.1 RES domain-containing protein [Pseudomonas mandelii]
MNDVVCFSCVIDHHLTARIKRKGVSAVCTLCKSHRKCISLKELAKEVEELLSAHIRLAEPPYPRSYFTEGEDLATWVSEIFQCDSIDEIVVAICEELTRGYGRTHRKFRNDEYYVGLPSMPINVESAWVNFKSGMMHGNRYFNEDAKKFLKWLFKDIDRKSFQKTAGFVQTLQSGKSIYRARLCKSSQDLEEIMAKPMTALAAPPKDKASAGRMNSVGVPAFYGAFARATCVAELRPPVGGRVISGRFKLTRPARLLNFKTLESAYLGPNPSFFEPNYQEKTARREALRMLHQKISTPVLPGEEREYLITQVIAEYLATQHAPRFDGVIFSSAQNKSGNNIVLFAHALSTTPEPDEYRFTDLEPKFVEPGIEYVPETLVVHEIEGVRFKTKPQKVIDGRLPAPVDDDAWDF